MKPAHSSLWLALLPGLLSAGTTVVESIDQVTPPGSVGTSQVTVIETDRNDNTRVLNIGSPGGVTVVGGKPRPCRKDAPTSGMDCTGHKLGGVQWAGRRLSGGFFDQADLSGADLSGADLTNASFDGARLNKARLARSRLTNGSFDDADLRGADLSRTDLTNCSFDNADLRNANLAGARLTNTDFDEARLEGARWVDSGICGPGSIGRCRR